MGPGLKGVVPPAQDRRHEEKSSARGCPNNGISTQRLQCSNVKRHLQQSASKSANPATPTTLRARSFGLRTHTSQRQFTGRLTSLQILFLVLLFDLTYKPPVSFACIDCRSCCLSFVSRTSPFDRVSAARELRFPQMDQLDIRQSRN